MEQDTIFSIFHEMYISFLKILAARYKEMNLDVTPIHSRIIMYLYEHEEDVFQKRIEDFLCCNKSTLSAILNTMEKNGLINRVCSVEDSRKKHIRLTEKSLRVVHALKKDNAYVFSLITQGISEDEKEQFVLFCEKLKKNMERI